MGKYLEMGPMETFLLTLLASYSGNRSQGIITVTLLTTRGKEL